VDGYNGAPDRFEWKLLGKREVYVPYNTYRIGDKSLKYKDIIGKNTINADLVRYELHRVWVVEATLKEGQRHINPRRTFYVDEDSWQILVLDHYDSQGEIWRYSEAPSVNYYEVPVFWTTLETHHDLKSGRYIVSGLDNEDDMVDFSHQSTPDSYSPQNLRARGVR
jgi:hypothetical protein